MPLPLESTVSALVHEDEALFKASMVLMTCLSDAGQHTGSQLWLFVVQEALTVVSGVCYWSPARPWTLFTLPVALFERRHLSQAVLRV